MKFKIRWASSNVVNLEALLNSKPADLEGYEVYQVIPMNLAEWPVDRKAQWPEGRKWDWVVVFKCVVPTDT